MKKYHYLLLIFLLLCGIGYGLQRIMDSKVKDDSQEITVVEDTEETNLDEGVEVMGKEHLLKLTIISPEEETFNPGQARMYNSLLEGNQKYDFASVRCNWKFYLNENNEEKLIQEMNNSSVMSGESKELCGFTSSFIDRVGVLRVVLNATLYNAIGDLESVEAERTYTVVD
ncbi:MAG TPA: hypothetical protein PLG47_00960 [Candidatus Dojkabacteria bacterium]|jgi:hypothetical protein|nr:hypothetical protein [Candidatus Dojkabacteria bacterium]